jgi:hypothetical protein
MIITERMKVMPTLSSDCDKGGKKLQKEKFS